MQIYNCQICSLRRHHYETRCGFDTTGKQGTSILFMALSPECISILAHRTFLAGRIGALCGLVQAFSLLGFLFLFFIIFKIIYFFRCTRSQLQLQGSFSCSSPAAQLQHANPQLQHANPQLQHACGIQFPDQGLNPGPLHWEHRVLSTAPPGKSLCQAF